MNVIATLIGSYKYKKSWAHALFSDLKCLHQASEKFREFDPSNVNQWIQYIEHYPTAFKNTMREVALSPFAQQLAKLMQTGRSIVGMRYSVGHPIGGHPCRWLQRVRA